MTFVDPLAFQLFTLVFVSTLIFYSGITGYLTYSRRGPRATYQLLRAQAVPLGVVGVAIAAIGLWGEVTWPIAVEVNGTNVLGAYNILFYDPYLMLGFVLVAFAVSVEARFHTQYVGLLAGMTGALSIYYGIAAYQLNLTKEPLAMLALYVVLGGTALLTFPVTIFLDKMVMEPAQANSDAPDARQTLTLPWKVAFGGFVLFLLFAAISALVALTIGGGALSPHLASPP